MALIKPLRGIYPRIGKNCFLAENATIVGDVEMGDDCSVWFYAVIRGDVHYIKIGNNVNIQDHVVVHATYQRAPTNIGNNVSIAHHAVVHGCTIGDNVLIGMGAMVMDGVVIESNSIIAAGSVVTQGTRVETGSVYGGTPAKKVKAMSKDLLEGEVLRIANNYGMYAGWYKEEVENK
jgi:carbonic anhydrase/acetyltransferase-like protein (isoleucine patch superfamily)